MKFPLLASVLIVAATAVIAILQGGRLGDLKQEYVVLEKEAISLGISPDGGPASKSDLASTPGTPFKGSRGSKAPGARTGAADPKAEGAAFAKELFAFWKKVKDLETKGTEPSLEDRKAMFEFINRFLSLDAEVIPYLMAEIRGFSEMDDDAKREILGMALMAMAQSAPEKAMELYINSGDLFGENRRADHMVGMALGTWAAKDPRAALEWIELHGPSLKEEVVTGARNLAIANAFKSDPDFAVEMTLKLDNAQIMALSGPLGHIMGTPQNQLDLMRGLQDKLGALPEDPNQINERALETATSDQVLRGSLLVGLGSLLAQDSFASASQFLESASLSPSESAVVAKGITSNPRQLEDPGSWLPWLHANSPATAQNQVVSNVVRDWTRTDFRSTAEWITEQPPGPLRETATYSFAETVAPHEPASAADWALTLPDSPQRTELLQNIQQQWTGKDPAAAAAFAAEHGLAAPASGNGIIEDP